MEGINKKAILAAVALACFTTFLVYIYIKNSTVNNAPQGSTYAYIAEKTISPKTKITESDIKSVKLSKEDLNPSAVLNKADIIGKRAKDRIIKGEQILYDRLVEENGLSLASRIPKGKRAVSINVDEQSAVSNLAEPGDYVDIVASLDRDQTSDKTGSILYPKITEIIIQNIEILSIGQEMDPNIDGKREIPKTITLAVSPQDAEKLVYASDNGLIRLILRSNEDDSNADTNTNGVIRNDLVSSKGTQSVPNK